MKKFVLLFLAIAIFVPVEALAYSEMSNLRVVPMKEYWEIKEAKRKLTEKEKAQRMYKEEVVEVVPENIFKIAMKENLDMAEYGKTWLVCDDVKKVYYITKTMKRVESKEMMDILYSGVYKAKLESRIETLIKNEKRRLALDAKMKEYAHKFDMVANQSEEAQLQFKAKVKELKAKRDELYNENLDILKSIETDYSREEAIKARKLLNGLRHSPNK